MSVVGDLESDNVHPLQHGREKADAQHSGLPSTFAVQRWGEPRIEHLWAGLLQQPRSFRDLLVERAGTEPL